MSDDSQAPATDSSDSLSKIPSPPSVASIRQRIESMSPGDQAALRRDPATTLAFYKLRSHEFPFVFQPETMERWIILTRVIAILCELYAPTVSLGTALAASRLSEMRLTRLLRAEGPALHAQILACARFLAAKGERQNLRDFQALLSFPDRGSPRAERVRQHIASDYFAALQA